MGKNKRQKQSQRTSKHVTQKPHEPTAMELAYEKAQKGKDVSVAKKIEGDQPSAPKKIEISTLAPAKAIVFQINTTTIMPIEAKPLSTPLPSSPIKKVQVVQQQSQNKSKLPKRASTPNKKPDPVKLGLEHVIDKSLVLGSVDRYQEKINSRQEKRQKEEIPLTGKTQVYDGNHSDESDIVIGFDFGTSSSKVVIRDSVLQTAYAVPFNSLACSDNSYLIPTRLFINEDGFISLSAGDHLCGNIKSRLMDDPDQDILSSVNMSITVSEVAAGYISLVIRLARAWFLKHTESIYKKTHIHWHLNLGIPSKNYDDLVKRKSFQAIAMAAWRISLLDLPISMTKVKKVLREAHEYTDTGLKESETEEFKSQWLHPDFVSTHPEVIMEVFGYASSPLRTSGLHLIVDVGATTLDAATFIIHKNEEEYVFPILETAVERLGTMMLHNKRVCALKTLMEESLSEINAIDPTRPLPDLSHYVVRASDKQIHESEESFYIECSKMISKAVKNTKRHRDPNSSVWQEELPVFICGGGGRLPSYRTMITELGIRCAEAWNDFRGFAIREIPKPEKLSAPDLPHKDYDRLAVAYGLSFTSDEIGEVIPESKISNIVKQSAVSNIDDRFVSKDMC